MSTKKVFSYSNVVRKTTALKIEEIPIPIKDWLKHYGLEEFHHTIFVEKHKILTLPGPHETPYEPSELLTNIKTNVDLLFSFPDSFKFKDAISVPVGRKLLNKEREGLITQDEVQNGETELRFFKAFELLLGQKLEYKAMLSVFGRKPTKTKYDSTLESNLEFLDHKNYKSKNIFKDEIVAKLKLISFDDLLHCKQTTFNLLLSLPIEEIKKYIVYNTNKLVKITKGLKPSMNKKQFNKFIDDNESLKVFESCYNNYDLKYVNKSLKSNFDAKSFLSTHRMDLLEYIFNPSKLIESEVSEEIYATLFPDSDHIYIDEQFSRINKSIPKTPMTDALMKQYKPKIRVFYIQGHAAACTIEDYKKKNRVDFQKVFTNIQDRQQKEYIRTHSSKIHKYNANKFNVVSTQPVGRKSIFQIMELLNKILSSKYRNIFLQGLINANKLEHLRILENVVHMFFSYYCINKWHSTSVEKISPYLKKSKLKHATPSNTSWMYSFPKTSITTTDIVNFVKYGYEYPPINTHFYFETGVPHQGLMGVFELNEDNADDLLKLDNKIASILKKDNKLKLGLKLNEVYEFRGDIPTRTDEILKYNKALPPRPRPFVPNMYTLEELMELIYLEGDIKPDEYVVIFDNSCRGIKPLKVVKPTESSNTSQDLSMVGQHGVAILRMNSMEKSLGEELGGGSRRRRRLRRTKRTKRTKK
jgi:hypothetical protein